MEAKPMEDEFETLESEESTKSLQSKLTHLGFHAQPTKTPRITEIHKGAINIIISLKTSAMVGLLKISHKTKVKPMLLIIINKPKERNAQIGRKAQKRLN